MTLTAEKIAQLDATIPVEMEKRKIIGLAAGLVLDNQITLKTYGLADRENQIPVTVETRFRLASITKPIAAVAAMQLVEQGRLDLDQDIRHYVPEFPDKSVVITTRHLLNHQGGLNHYGNLTSPRDHQIEHPLTDPIAALDVFKNEPLLFSPGEKCAYSSYGYMLLSAVIQNAGQNNFASQIEDRIAKPLGLSTLQPDYPWENMPHRAAGYRLHEGKIISSGDTDQSWKWGAGNYLSNIGDITKFAEALLQNKLLHAETLSQMWSKQTTSDGKISEIVYGGSHTPYGLGFQLQLNEEGETIKAYHTGGQEKVRTRLVLYPTENIALVVMTNCEWANPAFFSTLIHGLMTKD